MEDSLYNELNAKNAQPSNYHPVFLAQKDVIAYALSKGYSRKTIWEDLKAQKKFGGCYITFCSYVTRYITNNPILEATQTQPKKEQTQPKASTTKPPQTFDWSPNYDPEDLY